jgi:hypothetical protein
VDRRHRREFPRELVGAPPVNPRTAAKVDGANGKHKDTTAKAY